MPSSASPDASIAENTGYDLVTLVIRPERRMGERILLSVWVAGWAIAGFSVLLGWAEFDDQTGRWWFLLWAISLVFFGYALAWVLTGREVLRVAGQALDYELVVLGMARGRRLVLRDIHAVELCDTRDQTGEPLISIPFRLLGRGGSVQFSIAGRRRSLGYGVAGREAESIVEWMRRHAPEASK